MEQGNYSKCCYFLKEFDPLNSCPRVDILFSGFLKARIGRRQETIPFSYFEEESFLLIVSWGINVRGKAIIYLESDIRKVMN